MLSDGVGSVPARAREFDRRYETSRREVGQGDDPRWMSFLTIQRQDPYYTKQPKWRRGDAKYEWV